MPGVIADFIAHPPGATYGIAVRSNCVESVTKTHCIMLIVVLKRLRERMAYA
jgi:hypothetical protein